MADEEREAELFEEEELPPLVDYSEPQSEEDDVVGFCADCGTVLPDRMVENDIFLSAGKTGVCKICGGPMVVAYKSAVEALRRRRQAGGHLL